MEETYKIFTLLLVFGLMYPNPKTDKMRGVGLCIMYLLCVPIISILLNDMCIRFQDNDIENMVRQIVIIVALIFSNVKTFLTLVYRKELREIFNGISEDYAAFNDLSEDYQEVVEDTIRESKFLEAVWASIIGTTAGIFPVSAIILNIYFYLFTDTPRRFMVHECQVWGLSAEQQYSSPIYELFFMYSFFAGAVIFFGFSAYDGMFSICMFHLSLKIKILSKNLEYMLDKSDIAKTNANIGRIVREQYVVYDLRDKLMKTYEVWLMLVFVISVTQTGMGLSQIISSDGGANIIFIIFVLACTAHIYFPCHITSEVTHTAAKLADALYSTPWEDIPDPGVRRSVAFMIARVQQPMDFKAMDLITFNMDMFVSVMQTAYSMFTLLRS